MSRRAAAPEVGSPAYQKHPVIVAPSPIDGHGVFAAGMIPMRVKIGEIRGEAISCVEGRRRAATLQRIMIVEISSRTAIDASRSTDPMRFTNHSCQSNARLTVIGGRIEFWSTRAIAPGEEITVDYGITHHGGQLKCRCGVPGCDFAL